MGAGSAWTRQDSLGSGPADWGGTGGDGCDSGWLSGSALPVVTMLEPRPFAQLPAEERRPATVSTGLYILRSASRRDSWGRESSLQPSWQSGAGGDPVRTRTQWPRGPGLTVRALSLGRRDPEKPAVGSGVSDQYVVSLITADPRSAPRLGGQVSRPLGTVRCAGGPEYRT